MSALRRTTLFRNRYYRAEMYDDKGEEYTFFFVSNNIRSARLVGRAEADVRFMSLSNVKQIKPEEYLEEGV